MAPEHAYPIRQSTEVDKSGERLYYWLGTVAYSPVGYLSVLWLHYWVSFVKEWISWYHFNMLIPAFCVVSSFILRNAPRFYRKIRQKS